jgi:hypothetical protein
VRPPCILPVLVRQRLFPHRDGRSQRPAQGCAKPLCLDGLLEQRLDAYLLPHRDVARRRFEERGVASIGEAHRCGAGQLQQRFDLR